jgi:hypothetical protein
MCRKMRNSYWFLVGKAEDRRRHKLENAEMNLERNRVGRCRLHASDSEQAQVVGSFEHRNEPLGDEKCVGFQD